ncbi:unnamed protein product [Spirodela intermedia]|uniref:Uncharacterized protein n=1 Tax=Spirodela intermedia TaxID=51605 RepID=A0A7I8J4X5_SPIIN|nr:unnamed protein product [Spirodela intermedia]CAA6664431.1 unnamed protein product [Spirodela intermedia]
MFKEFVQDLSLLESFGFMHLFVDSRLKTLESPNLEVGFLPKIRALWIQAPYLIYLLHYDNIIH